MYSKKVIITFQNEKLFMLFEAAIETFLKAYIRESKLDNPDMNKVLKKDLDLFIGKINNFSHFTINGTVKMDKDELKKIINEQIKEGL